ncbi:hypothetical protein ABZ478_20960 [Streptomyces sp. NPDC005706]|uniref:hypothetical protein n=1 Tax=unclassified Streptomyces TaxID=2593676 RepID=UPI0033C1EA17
MFQDTPIYSRLVAERGDVPAEVRGEADRIHHDLARAIPQAAAHAFGSHVPPAAAWAPGRGHSTGPAS